MSIERLLKRYAEGVFDTEEMPVRIISQIAAERDVRSVLNTLPPNLRDAVLAEVRQAPTTDEGWSAFGFIASYCGDGRSQEEVDADEYERIKSYRSGVECILSCVDGTANT